MAVIADSKPLLPALVPARSMACSMVSVVSTPKTTGTPVSSCACWMPAAHWPATLLVVAGRAADDRAEADDGVELARAARAAARPAAARTRRAPTPP